ncbi:uncharacterized protein K444DRAFT_625337 [Hyaloscypha bicolor E]|uniref:4Fe-4S ferredoxin-type domain-containing protein n=1 Tax=Hyaloscypha bicolor E TaxID=1095630 RepID=A0A2J6TNS3_9HELO|nr:uncharacterized protein K444DRAFT_625337 [Hyaloscypha bicolor E]PMD64673.1 hypothetical protein K444DRAFT_625337 [Hyaloscypha bicolor E]
MRLFGILLPAFAGLTALLTLASAKPVLTAVKSPPARDIEIPFSDCCALWAWPKRDEDGILRAYHAKDELVEFVKVEPVSARVTGTSAKSLDSEMISAGDLELVGPPHLVKQQVCCTPGCKWCPWNSCCSLEVRVGKRDEEGLAEAYSQDGELVTWVGAAQFSERDVQIVGPSPLAKRLCCTSDCESCVGSCETVGCPIWPWTNCCALWVWPRKRDGTDQAFNTKGELVQFVDTFEPLSNRDVDWAGPPPPHVEQFCCSIGCRTCGDAHCEDTRVYSPFSSCCTLEFTRKGTILLHNWLSPMQQPGMSGCGMCPLDEMVCPMGLATEARRAKGRQNIPGL